MTVVVTGAGWALPGGLGPEDLLAERSGTGTPVDAAARIGGRGLRYKDRATQLALCAARDALVGAALLRDPGLAVSGDHAGVVVSTNLGNVDTVCRVVDTIAREMVTGTSPMDLPNASSNVVASTIAIRYGLRGVNLTLCNGATSGLDALYWAGLLVSTGRVEQVLVVGVEPTNEAVDRLLGHVPALDGAAAVVVEEAAAAARRGVPALARIGVYARRSQPAEAATEAAREPGACGPVGLVLAGGTRPARDLLTGVPCVHVAAGLGECSGALGVLQCLAATAWLARHPDGRVVAVGGGPDDDASAALVLQAAVAA